MMGSDLLCSFLATKGLTPSLVVYVIRLIAASRRG